MRPTTNRSARGGVGCLIALVAGLLLIGVIGVVLFLPPFSLGDKLNDPLSQGGFTILTRSRTDTTDTAFKQDGLTIQLAPPKGTDSSGTSTLAIKVQPIASDVFQAGFAATPDADDPVALRTAHDAAAARGLHAVSAIYRLQARGTVPTFTLSIAAPAGVDRTQADLYRYDSAANRWSYLPAESFVPSADSSGIGDSVALIQAATIPDRVGLFIASKISPTVSATIEIGQTMTPRIGTVASVVHPAGLQPTAQGTLSGALPAGIELNRAYAVIPVIRNFRTPDALDVATVATLLQDPSLREAHIAQLVTFATSKSYKGLAIDYRGLKADPTHSLSDQFSAFITSLADHLHNANLTLTVIVALDDQASRAPFDSTTAYDLPAIGMAADSVEIILPLDPRLYAPNGDLDHLLGWLSMAVNRAKLHISMSLLSVQQTGETFAPISAADAFAPLGTVAMQQPGAVLPGQPIAVSLNGMITRFDVEQSTITYFEATGAIKSVIWVATADALRGRLARLSVANVGGVLLTDIADPNSAADALAILSSYVNSSKTGQAVAAVSSPFAILWTAQQGSSIVATALSAPGTPFVYKPDNRANSVQIVANLMNGGGNTQPTLGALSVAVVSVTPTPSITPTASITPIPTATPTDIPSPVPPTSRPIASPPIATSISTGHISGGFESGGQVQALNGNTQAAMRRAGMKWVKQQVQMGDGNGLNMIGQVHAAGFKILLSVVGNKDAVTQSGYFDQYASYVGSLAAAGADAIEVWNEANIDREWATGKIDPALYTQLLAKAYNAIKAAHSSTVVISGAPAPTGAEGAFGLSRVWNDDHYYAGMAAAGAANYADCIGAHYNEGIVGPNQTSGDPRDNYPTRYFSTMLNRAAAPFGGKPVCFTELGYLSPEGYSAAPAGFEWAQNTTVAQQAAWLAQVAVRASNSGRVRLLIVFNVDFTYYAADPQAGYAMIRPGSGCPACDALAQVAK